MIVNIQGDEPFIHPEQIQTIKTCFADANTQIATLVKPFRSDDDFESTQLPQSALELAESLEQLRWLENGYKIKVGITEQETIGIDTPEDMEKALAFLANR